jgi:ribosomal protein S18 acetylase RimI-like enzyme
LHKWFVRTTYANTMKHKLDNPAWNAMTTGNRDLAYGGDTAKYFPRSVSPFAGVLENSYENFEILMDLVPFDDPVAIFTNEKSLDVAPWVITNRIPGFQMIFDGHTPKRRDDIEIRLLNGSQVPAMLELTKLAPPGPFTANTIAFGEYEGVFDGSKLVAMAGQRFNNEDFIEISAVCTHPDYTGRGYARELIYNQIRVMQEKGINPYLHVRADNMRAIDIYHKMGFKDRQEMIIYFLEKQ